MWLIQNRRDTEISERKILRVIAFIINEETKTHSQRQSQRKNMSCHLENPRSETQRV